MPRIAVTDGSTLSVEPTISECRIGAARSLTGIVRAGNRFDILDREPETEIHDNEVGNSLSRSLPPPTR